MTNLLSLRSKRDPNAPKRPLCGFMYFSAEERGKVIIHYSLLTLQKLICLPQKVRQENPNFAVGQIGKELGRRWAEADPEVRRTTFVQDIMHFSFR